MLKSRWMAVLALLLAHGLCESAQPAARTQPQPGSEAAVRRLLAEVAQGKVNFDLIAPALAEAVRPQLPQMQQDLLALGQVESVTFLHVNPDDGADIYSVKLTNGPLRVRMR